jgi:hypothetical protein
MEPRGHRWIAGLSTLSAYATVLPIVTARNKTKGQGIRSTTPRISTLWGYTKGIWSIVVFLLQVVAIASAVTLYFQFSPNISISPERHFVTSDAFRVPFVISNNGHWNLENVQSVCILNDVQFKGLSIRRSSISTVEGHSERLSPGEGLTVKCEREVMVTSFPPTELEKADIKISVTVNTFIFGKDERSFRFTAEKSEDGRWHWLPKPMLK